MLTCKEACVAVSGGVEDLDWRKRLSLRLHLLMCGAYRLYARQIERVRALAGASYREQTPDPEDLSRLEGEILAQLFDAPERPGERN